MAADPDVNYLRVNRQNAKLHFRNSISLPPYKLVHQESAFPPLQLDLARSLACKESVYRSMVLRFQLFPLMPSLLPLERCKKWGIRHVGEVDHCVKGWRLSTSWTTNRATTLPRNFYCVLETARTHLLMIGSVGNHFRLLESQEAHRFRVDFTAFLQHQAPICNVRDGKLASYVLGIVPPGLHTKVVWGGESEFRKCNLAVWGWTHNVHIGRHKPNSPHRLGAATRNRSVLSLSPLFLFRSRRTRQL